MARVSVTVRQKWTRAAKTAQTGTAMSQFETLVISLAAVALAAPFAMSPVWLLWIATKPLTKIQAAHITKQDDLPFVHVPEARTAPADQ